MSRILGITASAILKSSGGGGVTVPDPDAQLFVDNAGILIQAEGDAVNDFVIYLKGYSLWSKIICLNVKVGGTASQHKFNLKDPRDLDVAFRYTYGGTWVHGLDGAKANGTNSLANTYVNLNTLGLNGNFSFGYYLTVANTLFNDKHGMGAFSSATNWVTLQHNFSTEMLGYAYGPTGTSLTISGANNDFFALSVNGTTKKVFHKNLVSTATTNGTSVPTINLYEGCFNFFNAYYFGLDATYGTSFVAEGLTETEIGNLRTSIITFETALGRNV